MSGFCRILHTYNRTRVPTKLSEHISLVNFDSADGSFHQFAMELMLSMIFNAMSCICVPTSLFRLCACVTSSLNPSDFLSEVPLVSLLVYVVDKEFCGTIAVGFIVSVRCR